MVQENVDINFTFNVMDNASGKFKKLETSLDAVAEKAGGTTTKAFKKLDGGLNQLKGSLLGASLSLLFFGITLKRIATSIAKSSLNSFNKIVGGTEEATGAVGALLVNFELLKVSVGEALSTFLEALLPVLIPIIEKISDWVQQNQGLTAGIIAFLAITGGLLAFFGTLGSALVGAIEAFSLLKTAISAVGWAAFGEAGAAAIAGISFSTILGGLALVTAAVILAYLMWKNNFAGIQELIDSFGNSFTTILGEIYNSTKTVFRGIFDIIEGFLTSDWEQIGQGFVKIWDAVLRLAIIMFTEFWAMVTNISIFAVRGLNDVIVTLLDGMVSGFRAVANALGFDSLVEKLNKAEEIVDSFKSGGRNQLFDFSFKSGKDFGQDFLLKFFVGEQDVKKKEAEVTKQSTDAIKEETTAKMDYNGMVQEATTQTQKLFGELGKMNIQLESTKTPVQELTGDIATFGQTAQTVSQLVKQGYSEWEAMFAAGRDLSTKNPRNANLTIGGVPADQYYRSGAVSEQILGKYFGDKLAGVGQFMPGALSQGIVQLYGNEQSGAVIRDRATQIHYNTYGQTNIQRDSAGNWGLRT